MCIDPARALRSCCCEFDRKQFECHSVLRSYLSYKLRMAGPELFSRRLTTTTKRHAQNSSFVEKLFIRKPGHGSWLWMRFSRTKSLRRSRFFCWLAFDSAGFASHFGKTFGHVLPAGIFACWMRLSAGLYPRCLSDSKARQALVSVALLFFSFWSERRRGSRSVPLAILVRTRREPALTQIMNAASPSGRGQFVSDHVERISGQPYGDFQSLADVSRKRCAIELRVKMDLSKLKSCRRSVTAC